MSRIMSRIASSSSTTRMRGAPVSLASLGGSAPETGTGAGLRGATLSDLAAVRAGVTGGSFPPTGARAVGCDAAGAAIRPAGTATAAPEAASGPAGIGTPAIGPDAVEVTVDGSGKGGNDGGVAADFRETLAGSPVAGGFGAGGAGRLAAEAAGRAGVPPPAGREVRTVVPVPRPLVHAHLAS